MTQVKASGKGLSVHSNVALAIKKRVESEPERAAFVSESFHKALRDRFSKVSPFSATTSPPLTSPHYLSLAPSGEMVMVVSLLSQSVTSMRERTSQ